MQSSSRSKSNPVQSSRSKSTTCIRKEHLLRFQLNNTATVSNFRWCHAKAWKHCGWGLISTHSCPWFWRSKKNTNSTQFIELYFGVAEQIKPLQPIGQAAEFKFESKFEPLPTSAGRLAITPEDYSRRQSKDLTAKSMAKLLGPRSGSACVGRTGEHKNRAFPSRRQ